jgi:plasmid maintenance system killer protein
MTKKSGNRIQRDIAHGKRKANAPAISMPMNQSLKPSGSGGFKISAADRILNECRQGALLPKGEQNTCWDDLNNVYGEMSSILLRHTGVSAVLRDQELLGFIEDKPTFRTNVNQFAADLRQMSEELQQLRSLHFIKSGGSEDPEDVLHSIHIFEQYNLWMQKHDGVLMPTVFHILEATNQAELARANAGQVSLEVPQEQVDPAVLDVDQITDVTFSDENVGQVVGVPEVKSTLNLQAAIDRGLAATTVEAFEEAAKPRGMHSPIAMLDEAAFYAHGTPEADAAKAEAQAQ